MRPAIILAASGILSLAACAQEPAGSEPSASASEAAAADSQGEAGADAASEVATSPAPGSDSGATRIAGAQWFERKERGRRAWAGFGPPFSEAAFSARCEGDRLIFNTTEMPPSGPGKTQMRLTFGGSTKPLDATASEEGLPNTDAAVPADAAWLDQLASASGDLTVTVGASDPLTLPISEPLTSLIRDCGGR